MKREKFSIIKSSCIPLNIENVDTDQIIPARFLKATSREGFGENLFRDWRYSGEKENKEFVLNNSKYKGNILVAGKNFGSGSSREHAAWALCDYGFRVIISSFFADIFRNNALNNGLLPIRVRTEFLQELFSEIKNNYSAKVMVNLPDQTVTIVGKNFSEKFDIDPYKKECLIKGYDDIDYLLNMKKEIIEFAKNRPLWL